MAYIAGTNISQQAPTRHRIEKGQTIVAQDHVTTAIHTNRLTRQPVEVDVVISDTCHDDVIPVTDQNVIITTD